MLLFNSHVPNGVDWLLANVTASLATFHPIMCVVHLNRLRETHCCIASPLEGAVPLFKFKMFNDGDCVSATVLE